MSSINDIVKRLRENRILNEKEDYNSKDTVELIQLAQIGDQLAIETLYHRYEDFLIRMTNKYFLQLGDRDDVIQVANIAFWKAIEGYDPDKNGDFEAYAGMIIKRDMTDEMRKEMTDRRYSDIDSTSLETPRYTDSEGGEMTVGDTLKSKSGSAEEQYLGKAGADDLTDFMKNNLSNKEKQAIRLYIKGYKISEISEELGMKYKSAENAVRRVKEKIAEWQKTRESKKIRESAPIEFTDEEKKVILSILDKIDEQKSL